VKGSNALHKNNWNLCSYKIGIGRNEVDLVDLENNLLCEVTMSDKRLADVNLGQHFTDLPIIRVLATKTINDIINGIHRITYPKLCMLMDNKSIYSLKPILTLPSGNCN